jgi:hypothetical protein
MTTRKGTSMSKPFTYTLAAIAAVTGALALAPGTALGAQAFELLSGNGANTSVFFDGNSADGTRMFFQTAENIPGTGDTDDQNDIYQAQDGAITLLTGNGAGGNNLFFDFATADGTRLLFDTDQNVPGTGDTDGLNDVYQAEAGTITLLSGSNPVGSGGTDAFFEGASADGSRVFFDTDENISGSGDVDGEEDVYQATGGAITLLTGSVTGTGAFFNDASADGTRVFFDTDENVAGAGDTDGLDDVYQVDAGVTTLLTGNNPAASGGHVANLNAVSDDGTRIFFSTTENIPGTGDSDGSPDIYQAVGGAITLLTGNGAATFATFEHATADGTRMYFETPENIAGTGDTDGAIDVYQAMGGVITLLSGNGGASDASYRGASADGTRAFFNTTENIPGTGDSDGADDVFQAMGGAITLLSGNDPAEVSFRGASADGTRVFFETHGNIPGTGDTDGANDAYQALGGAITLLTGSGTDDSAPFQGASADGTRVFFVTDENIPGTGDTDGAQDVYLSQTVASTSNPPPVTTPPTTVSPSTAPTGLRAKALKKCKKKPKGPKHKKCIKKAKKLPV